MKIEELLMKVRGRRVLVVGDVMLDHYVWGDASRISPEAPVPVVDVTRDSYAAGGAANVALNIASLGGAPSLAGRTGTDEGGERLSEILSQNGVVRVPGFSGESCQTIQKTRIMVRNQQLCRIDREGGEAEYRMDSNASRSELVEALGQADAVLLSDYGKGAISENLIEWLQGEAESMGIPVSLDPKPRRRLTFKGMDLLTPNRAEALELAGLSPHLRGKFPSEEVCARIWERYQPGHLVITLGADGILLSGEGRPQRLIPTYARQVFDVSGAGDTVIASLLLALSAGADLASAARLANLAAGVVVGKVGTATVTQEEILDYLSQHPDLADPSGETVYS
tara:strand:- start:30210 stop:31226 length:1017 start_codon:yes stop_codon:yes gene_type:complete